MKNDIWNKWIYLVISGIIFIYILLRAILIPAYHDEINTFFFYVQPGTFQPYYSIADQNNHVLNSLFSHLFFLLFGSGIFILRLANVISAALYLFYLWKTSRTFRSKGLAIAWFIVMGCQLYVISFFSLSRGYGISMAFLMMSIYHLISYFSASKVKDFIIGIFAGALAVWAYLGVMVAIIMLGILFLSLFCWRLYKTRKFRELIFMIPGVLVLYLIPLYYAAQFSFYIKQQDDIYGSGNSSFIKSVIISLSDEFAGNQAILVGRIVVVIIMAILFLGLILKVKRQGFKGRSLLVHALLWGTIAGTILLNLIFGVEYPTSRMAVFYFILFMIPVFLTADEANNRILNYAAYSVSAIFLFQFIITFNFKYAPCWRYDTFPKSFYKYIESEAGKTGLLPSISANNILGKEFEFQDFEHGGKLNTVTLSDYPCYHADYIISDGKSTTNYLPGCDVVLNDKATKTCLFKRRNPVDWKEDLTFEQPPISGNGKFMTLLPDVDCKPYLGHRLSIELDFNAQSARFPFRCCLVCDIWGVNNESISYNTINLQGIDSDVSAKTHFRRKFYFEKIPDKSSVIRLYCLNPYMDDVSFDDLKIKFFIDSRDRTK